MTKVHKHLNLTIMAGAAKRALVVTLPKTGHLSSFIDILRGIGASVHNPNKRPCVVTITSRDIKERDPASSTDAD
jgi:hypothetical protein